MGELYRRQVDLIALNILLPLSVLFCVKYINHPHIPNSATLKNLHICLCVPTSLCVSLCVHMSWCVSVYLTLKSYSENLSVFIFRYVLGECMNLNLLYIGLVHEAELEDSI